MAFPFRDMHLLRRLCLLLLLLPVCAAVQGQAKWNQRYQNYFDRYKDLAIEQMLRYHIPASITLAQGVFESGAGLSRLATVGNNHFGIKCHGWRGRTISEDDDDRGECFRAYDSPQQSYEDHSRFLSGNTRYARLFKLKSDDYRGWARGLKAAGYATNPQYAQKLIEIIELYKLHKYDGAKSYDKFMAQHSGSGQRGGGQGKGAGLHSIRIYNDNYYLRARTGDTFAAIGKEVELSGRKLAKYNERDYRDVLHEGDIVWLKKKQKRAPKELKGVPHVVKAGESMYDVAQKYGIRLKSLYKMNKLSPDHQIRVGERLRVR